ncbi:hypothetical protein F8154_03265 [Alkaliphilus pronyensis]|uniref:Heavy-metal-associated domain-containing protein n=1 Tax=Alkaliphilus pronyensis TaxID=1482732 RepID=A0A6I0FLE6_9FIRM|nr:hypothetical protein [Alkaliphilus pronyensis]KAB3537324.1 hypothetical protein F8154_03265 [Alkaliphilus pronyensis]
MSIYNVNRLYDKKQAINLRLTIKNMLSHNDYNIIVKELKKVTGIKEIAPYNNSKILSISYWPSRLIFENIYYTIGILGYRIDAPKAKLNINNNNVKGG